MWKFRLRNLAPASEPVLADTAPGIAELQKRFAAFTEAVHSDLASFSARVEKLEYLLHQRDSMGQGPETVRRLPFREFKRLKESGLNPKGA